MEIRQVRQELPQLVHEIRGELSQEEFAEQVGVTKSAVSQWENGKIWLSLEAAIKLLKWTKENRPGLMERLLVVIGAEEVVA